MIMDRETVVRSVLELANRIAEIENELLDLEFAYRDEKMTLSKIESDLLLGETINGKNEATRTAQLQEATRMERLEVEQAERAVMRRRLGLNQAKLLHQSWVTIGNWHFGNS